MAMDNVHNDTRVGWLGLASIWIGGMISIPALMLGSALAAGMPFLDICLASLCGFAVVAVVMSLQSVAAVERRQDTMGMARNAFGSRGAELVIGTTVGLALTGWFAVQTEVASRSLVRIVQPLIGVEVQLAYAAFGLAAFMVLFAVLGFRHIKWLNYIAAPFKFALVGYAVFLALRHGSVADILAYRPAAGSALDFSTAVGLATGSFAVGAVIAPDYARFCVTKRDAVLGTLFGILPAAMAMVLCGAVLSILMRTHDIVDIYARTGMPLLALSVLIVATWTINVMNAYSAGLALQPLLRGHRAGRELATVLVGVAGAALAGLGMLTHFNTFLMLLTVVIPPIAGVLLADHWFGQRGQATPGARINVIGVAGWLCGAGATFLVSHPLRSLLGIGVAAGAYALLRHRAAARLARA